MQFSQEEEEKITNVMGTMSEVQDALVKQLETLKYLTPQAAISSLTGDTADSLAILKQAYSTFDIDGDGVITSDEVKTLLKGLGVHISHESLSDLFARFDKDGNNALDFNEFVMLMRSMKQVSERQLHRVITAHSAHAAVRILVNGAKQLLPPAFESRRSTLCS